MVTPALRIGGTRGTEPGRNSWDALGAETFVGKKRTANAISGTQRIEPFFADAEQSRLKCSGTRIQQIISLQSGRLFLRLAGQFGLDRIFSIHQSESRWGRSPFVLEG